MCQEGGGSKRGVLGGPWGFLAGDMEDRVIPDTMNHVYLPQGRYSAKFCDDIFIGSVSGRGGVKKGVTWRTLRVPDRRQGGQCHP